MHWVIRWADEQDCDRATVVEADTRDAADLLARSRGLPVIFVARATQADIAEARRRPARWGAADTDPGAAGMAPGPAPRYTCLGRHVGGFQLAALMLTGVATVWLHLRPVLPSIIS